MKKGKKRVFFILVITSILVFQIWAATALEDGNNKGKEDVSDAGKKAGEDFSDAAKDLRESASSAIEKKLTLSSSIDKIARVLFGLEKDEEISLQRLVVLVCIFFILLLFIRQFVSFSGEKGPVSWVISLLFSVILGALGAIQTVSDFFFGVAGMFEPLKRNKLIQLLVSLVIVFVVFGFFSKITNLIKKKIEKDKVRRKAEKAGEGITAAEKLGETLSDFDKD